ncbi:hypothetical protein FB480_103439 [Agrobacterium vitis]|nr:hypothetical protein FB480_103439 [Agrobacterium vitis]
MDDLSALARLELCKSDADFARWFLTESDSGFCAVFEQANNEFLAAQFDDGLRALDVRRYALNAQRLSDGNLPQTILMRLEEQKSRMREIASKGGA